MRKILLVGWLVLPIGAWAYHEGPGQDRVALEATDAVMVAAHQAASDGDWKLAIREYEAALESLPKDPDAYDERIAQRRVGTTKNAADHSAASLCTGEVVTRRVKSRRARTSGRRSNHCWASSPSTCSYEADRPCYHCFNLLTR